MNDKKNTYDEESIQHLSHTAHIRLRPGMYIGRLGNGSHVDDGIYILLKEVIDNSIDEFVMGYGKNLIVQVSDKSAMVRDFGRGIPLGKVIDCVSEINTGAKYTGEAFKYSVGLNGVGTKAVNALSSKFHVCSIRGGRYFEASFERGVLISSNEGTTAEKDGVLVEFTPDEQLFRDYHFSQEFLVQRIENYCYLNSGLRIDFNGTRYLSSNGLMDLLNSKMEGAGLYQTMHYSDKTIEFCFTHTGSYNGETFYSYVNGQYTSDGGTHLAAFKEAITKGINEFFRKQWNPMDIREGMVGAIAIKIQNPVFESQTKNKLGNTDVRTPIIDTVKLAIMNYLHKNPQDAGKLLEKITSNENIRTQLAEVKKLAKENSKKVAINIKILKDCKYHLGKTGNNLELGESSMIFLTEGRSASGTLTKVRDVLTQAVFSMKGNPKNVEGKDEDVLFKNEELYLMTSALGIVNGSNGLRYGKVIFATDADIDGYHIRNLLLSFFMSFYPQLIEDGRIFILDTPLFRVRNKKENIYCYSEAEKKQAMNTLRNAEITRFKGLGELSAEDFKKFIGKEMKLIPVTVSDFNDANDAMHFYMGKNTPQKKEYILENLRIED